MASTTTEFNLAYKSYLTPTVVQWELGMTYTYGTSGQSDFYQSDFSTTIESSWVTGLSSDFTPKAESSWTRAQLLTLMQPSTALWDPVFASQVDSVIINPPSSPEPDNNYVIPDES